MAPLPAGYQLQIANFLTGQLAQKTSDVEEARQHVQRAINALGGTRGTHYKVDHKVKNPTHGLGLGEGAIAELEHMVGQHIVGAREAHKITQIAHEVLVRCLDQKDIGEIQRLSTAGALLLQAAVAVVSF
jgi:hypothetical protein